jgi:hypothetical protein
MALTDKLSAIGDAIRVQSGKTDLLTLDQMPEEIINLQSLNFEVVGNPQPENPKANTIWVNTDVPIPRWVFDVENPFIAEKELYDESVALTDAYIDKDGVYKPWSSDWKATDYIPLPEKAISVTIYQGTTSSTDSYHAFYDSDGNVVAVVKRTTGTIIIPVPDGASSIRITNPNANTSLSVIAEYYLPDTAEGAVWFPIGTSSPVAFNALKKNGIQVYPMSPMQYVGGALVAVEAKTYQDNEWKGWVTYIIKDGVIGEYGFKSITSGYTYPAKMTQYDGYVYLETSKDGYGGMGGTVEPIDLTGKTKVTAVIDVVKVGHSDSDKCPALLVATDNAISSASHVATALAKTTGLHTLEVDVSAVDGECWIGIRCTAYGSGSYCRIKVLDIYVG